MGVSFYLDFPASVHLLDCLSSEQEVDRGQAGEGAGPSGQAGFAG